MFPGMLGGNRARCKEISISMVLWKLEDMQHIAGTTRSLWQNEEGNFQFRISIRPLLSPMPRLPLGALELALGHGAVSRAARLAHNGHGDGDGRATLPPVTPGTSHKQHRALGRTLKQAIKH